MLLSPYKLTRKYQIFLQYLSGFRSAVLNGELRLKRICYRRELNPSTVSSFSGQCQPNIWTVAMVGRVAPPPSQDWQLWVQSQHNFCCFCDDVLFQTVWYQHTQKQGRPLFFSKNVKRMIKYSNINWLKALLNRIFLHLRNTWWLKNIYKM